MNLSIDYNSPNKLKIFLAERHIGMRKQFGQNFLINPSIRRWLVDALETRAGDSVWEIGPGLGAMTVELLNRGLFVTAFEIDSGFSSILKEIFGENPDFTLIEGDVLSTWNRGTDAPFLFGNLPYGIAAVLIATFIEHNRFFSRAVFTVQREIAERAAAGPGSKNYSAFSVLCASAYHVKLLPVIHAASFYPAPHVDSMGIRFDLRDDCDPAGYPALFRPLVRNLFASRRKTLKNNLKTFLGSQGKNPDHAADLLAESGIDGAARAETLRCGHFVSLAQTIESYYN
ncbi:ribosomal RNA small subunit methyltransferase A [Spirochaetia bacterium]|nr:ribosomal RNA small subunit methyltransferase A [Spirochaetia bacterium]GHU30801.1 ribosomal RNA small subunit methyltransferase A [Spirochaetia bacterium]